MLYISTENWVHTGALNTLSYLSLSKLDFLLAVPGSHLRSAIFTHILR